MDAVKINVRWKTVVKMVKMVEEFKKDMKGREGERACDAGSSASWTLGHLPYYSGASGKLTPLGSKQKCQLKRSVD